MPPVTLSDVARRAGVSPATASRAMNGRRHVSSDARRRVSSAMLELDFVPNAAARGLSMARTSTVTLLMHHAQYPRLGEGTFGARVLLGASRALQARGYALLYAAVDDADVSRLERLAATRASRSDGLLLLGPAFPGDAIGRLAADGRPLVLVDNRLAGVDCVLADNAAGMRRLTAHLIRHHAHRRIALLAGPAGWVSTEERSAPYRAALAAAAQRRHEIHAREHAGVAVNDAMAIGALRRARRRAAADRPAIVGFDDSAWASATDPPLTTVTVDAATMGALAAQRLVDRIEESVVSTADGWLVRQPVRLRVRRSCGCPIGARNELSPEERLMTAKD
jgi:LacI family transcriptional regulator